jgi:predicted GTPase
VDEEGERVVVKLPLDWLKSGLELVDTPGANNEFTRHQGFTRQEAQDADIAVMPMNVRQGGGKRSEFALRNEVGRGASRSFVALNKMDLVEDAEEREETFEYVAEERAAP